MIDEPLVRALAHNEAVAFVGSGASIPSGLPDWRKFLRAMLDFAISLGGAADWSRAVRLWEEGDFLLCAELLQRELPAPTFNRFIVETFGKAGLEPNEIHRSVARLPFSLAVTTNIDTLLESAYRNPATCTWQDPNAVFNAIRAHSFVVVKLHGSVSDPDSARLTRTHYRDGTLTNTELNECVKDLLTWKTFLFIGHSLRDSDLLYLLDEARLRFGRKFGPHYAIMPRDEADAKFQDYLRDALSIHTIAYDRDQKVPESATREVVRILKNLAGRVSRERYGQYGIGLGLNDPGITRKEAAQALLDAAAPMTGSMRADVCMIQDDIEPRLSPVAIYPRGNGMTLPESIIHDSVIESVFLQASSIADEDYVYLPDVTSADGTLKRLGYNYAKYEVCDTSVRSELACPIIADGRRVGTLNFESDLRDAYMSDHIQVAIKIANELGRIYLQSEERRRTAAPIEEYGHAPGHFSELMLKSRLIRALGHEFLLYIIDYENRKLIGHHRTGNSIAYGFDECSLANRVFQTRNPEYVRDAEMAVKQFRANEKAGRKQDVWLNPKGTEEFNIRGPVYACPMRVAGQTEAVLVTWLSKPEVLKGYGGTGWFRSSSRQVLRLSNLLANDIFRPGASTVETLLDEMYGSLDPIDGGGVWTDHRLADHDFCTKILDTLLRAALNPVSGLKRVRLWRAEQNLASSEPTGFKIVKWMTTPDITDQPAAKYVTGHVDRGDDIYTRYTLSRYRHDPTARWQHPAMFHRTDSRARELDKDPNGSWIVAPIVKLVGCKLRLEGFISADMHVPTPAGPKDQRSDDPRQTALQCRLLDVVSDLAQHVLPSSSPLSKAAGAPGA